MISTQSNMVATNLAMRLSRAISLPAPYCAKLMPTSAGEVVYFWIVILQKSLTPAAGGQRTKLAGALGHKMADGLQKLNYLRPLA
ncbi:MAG TPA: hypothetical protein VI424_17555, partial [Terriglobales bacterium]